MDGVQSGTLFLVLFLSIIHNNVLYKSGVIEVAHCSATVQYPDVRSHLPLPPVPIKSITARLQDLTSPQVQMTVGMLIQSMLLGFFFGPAAIRVHTRLNLTEAE